MKNAMTIGSVALAACAGSAFGQGLPLPVEFRTPSVLEIGPAPLPSAVEVNLAWPTDGVGAPITENVTLTLQASSQTGAIVPSPSGMAITTKGYGGPINRIMPMGGVPGSPVRGVTFDGLVIALSGPSVHVSQHEFALWTDLNNDGTQELSSQRLLVELEISALQGVQFAAAPQFVQLADGSLEIIAALMTPMGVVVDSNQDLTSYRFSAQVVPAPGAVAVIGLGGLLAAGGRRRR